MTPRILKSIGLAGFICLVFSGSQTAWTQGVVQAQESKPPVYRILKEPPVHTTGTVKMEVFVDFYCPHCHRFESSVLPVLTKEYGDKLEVTEIGLPVIRNKPMLPFEFHEAAVAMGKGPEMAQALFHVLQDENGDIQIPEVRIRIAREAGVDPDELKKRLLTGVPKRDIDKNIERAARDGVNATPTVILDGYVLTDIPTAENLRPIISKLLAGQEP
jgi:protein dithiol oxidoreductase (disulfide-forming)